MHALRICAVAVVHPDVFWCINYSLLDLPSVSV